MSIRAHIGILQEDGSVDVIYCHSGGSLNFTGNILLRHYRGKKKVRALIELGDISSLGKDLDHTKAYGRDLHEPNTKAMHFETHSDYEKYLKEHGRDIEYSYLFDTEAAAWYWAQLPFPEGEDAQDNYKPVLDSVPTCTKEMYERMRNYAREFNSTQKSLYAVLSVTAVNDEGACEFDEADGVNIAVYEDPEDDDYDYIVGDMQQSLNIDLHLPEWPTINGSGDGYKITGWELGIIPTPSGATDGSETASPDKRTPEEPTIESGQEYLLRVHVSEVGENYLVLETLNADGTTNRDETFFCLPRTMENQLIKP